MRYPIARSLRIGSKRKPKSMSSTSARAPWARIAKRRVSVSGMSTSRRWLSTVAQSASAETTTSVCARRGSSSTTALAASSTACARAFNTVSRERHAEESSGGS